LLYNAAVHKVSRQETGWPGLLGNRSGRAGSQRYPAKRGGEPKTDGWSMRASLRGGLNLALSPPGMRGHNSGGFYASHPRPNCISAGHSLACSHPGPARMGRRHANHGSLAKRRWPCFDLFCLNFLKIR